MDGRSFLICLILAAAAILSQETCNDQRIKDVVNLPTAYTVNLNDSVNISCSFKCSLITSGKLESLWIIQLPTTKYQKELLNRNKFVEMFLDNHNLSEDDISNPTQIPVCDNDMGHINLTLKGVKLFDNSVVHCGVKVACIERELIHIDYFASGISHIHITQALQSSSPTATTPSPTCVTASPTVETPLSSVTASPTVETPLSSVTASPTVETSVTASPTVETSVTASPTVATPPPTDLDRPFASNKVKASLGGVFVGGVLVGALGVAGAVLLSFLKKRSSRKRSTSDGESESYSNGGT